METMSSVCASVLCAAAAVPRTVVGDWDDDATVLALADGADALDEVDRRQRRPGIVAAVAGALYEAGGDIREAKQFDDTATGRFFMRVVFDRLEGARSAAEISVSIDDLAKRFSMKVSLRDTSARKRVMLLVSKFDHCLADLLYRWRIGELPMELTGIVSRSAQIMGIECEIEGAREVARRSRGTPRIANRLLRRVRDFAQMRGDGKVTAAIADGAMRMLNVDGNGLDDNDHRLLRLVIDSFNGGPVGIESLAAALSEERGTLEDVIEPYLIQQGYIIRTARGRMVTHKAYQLLGLKSPARPETLFPADADAEPLQAANFD